MRRLLSINPRSTVRSSLDVNHLKSKINRNATVWLAKIIITSFREGGVDRIEHQDIDVRTILNRSDKCYCWGGSIIFFQFITDRAYPFRLNGKSEFVVHFCLSLLIDAKRVFDSIFFWVLYLLADETNSFVHVIFVCS